MDEEGHKMSMYGRHELDPIEMSGQWKEIVNRDNNIHKNHLAMKGGTEHWPGVETISSLEERSYYNWKKEHTKSSTYDKMFHFKHDYNSHLHRDDREHTVGLNVHDEELRRQVPVLSSSAYGRRVGDPHEDPSNLRKHVRIERVMKGFYRTRGTGIPTSLDQAANEQHAH